MPKALPSARFLDGAEESHRFAPFALFGERLAHLVRGSSLTLYRLSAKRRKGDLHLKAERLTARRCENLSLQMRGSKPVAFSVQINRSALADDERKVEATPALPFLLEVEAFYPPALRKLFPENPSLSQGLLLRMLDAPDGEWKVSFRQGSLYFFANGEALRALSYHIYLGTLWRRRFSHKESFLLWLRDRIGAGNLHTISPQHPVVLLLQEEDEEALLAFKRFCDLLALGYGRVLERKPEARKELPAFLPDGRKLERVLEQAVLPPPEPPSDADPHLAMRSYWDLAALDLGLGKVDLLSFLPDPIDGLAFPRLGRTHGGRCRKRCRELLALACGSALDWLFYETSSNPRKFPLRCENPLFHKPRMRLARGAPRLRRPGPARHRAGIW